MKYVLSLIIACVVLSGCAPEPRTTSPSTVETPTAPPTVTTAEPTVTTAEWRQFTPAQIGEIDRLMDEYIERELAGAVLYDAELRYSMCLALEGNDWDWDRFKEMGESLVRQGVIPVEDWPLMKDLASHLHHLVYLYGTNAYLISRDEGDATMVPPVLTMGNAYCAHASLKP